MKSKVGIYIYSSPNMPSPEIQLEGILRKLNVKDYSIFSDSYKDVDKLEFQQLMTGVSNAEFSAVVCWRIDALSTEFTDMENLLSLILKIAKEGCRFISVADEVDTECSATEFIDSVMKAVTTLKKNFRTERLRLAFIRSRVTGKPVGRPRTRDDSAIKELRRKGLTFKAIAKELNVSLGAVQRALST